MGWSHHWTRPTELDREAFASAVRDIQAMHEAMVAKTAGFDGIGRPVLDEEHIVFNGCQPAHCEPFEIARVEFNRRGSGTVYSYCKTEHLPYDICVQAVLIILKHYLGDDLTVSSDGNDDAWQQARDLVSDALGYGHDFRLHVENEP